MLVSARTNVMYAESVAACFICSFHSANAIASGNGSNGLKRTNVSLEKNLKIFNGALYFHFHVN